MIGYYLVGEDDLGVLTVQRLEDKNGEYLSEGRVVGLANRFPNSHYFYVEAEDRETLALLGAMSGAADAADDTEGTDVDEYGQPGPYRWHRRFLDALDRAGYKIVKK